MSEFPQSAFELGRDGPRWIVVGVDGSLTSERAGAYAAGTARRQGSRLAVVFARDVSGEAALGSEAGVNAAVAAQDALEAELRELVLSRPWDVEVEFMTRVGAAGTVLAQVAQELSAGLIVVGASRSRAYLRPSGPVSAQLTRLRRWPVLVVP